MTFTLAELQASVQSAILADNTAALPLINKPPKGTTAQAFSVYQSAYKMRLRDFLANDFPVLRTYLGDIKFSNMARDYIKSHVPNQPNARWYSQGLPDFLATYAAMRENPECYELAQLERALSDVFDAAEKTPLTLTDLSAIPTAQISNLRLKLHPAIRRLAFTHNTTSIWSALKAEQEPPRPHLLEQHQEILVFRHKGDARFRILGAEESMALDCMEQGSNFAIVCEMMAMHDGNENVPLRAATYLRGWFEAELLSDFTWESATK